MSELTTAFGSHPVPETVDRLRAALDRRSITVFAQIDHAAGARAVGLELPDETVLVFGNPQAGTPLMHADPEVGIDLPVRILVWDQDGQTMLGYRDPTALAARYALGDASGRLEQMRDLLAELTAEAI